MADDNQDKDPDVAQVIHNDLYVDDLLSGSSTIEEAIHLRDGITSLLQTAGFELRKWASNSEQFLNDIPENSRESQQCLAFDSKDGVSTLGLLWLPKTDQLQVKNSDSSSTTNVVINTKRKVLARVASIFDPLGLISPSVIVYKTYLQRLWQDKLPWDEQLSSQLQNDWDKLSDTISQLSNIYINRKVICTQAVNVQLHGFCDSSERAYGACFYLRSADSNDNTFCNLLCSSSRVAPLKTLTIPQLELCAAVLLVKLYKRIINALRISISATYMWTDSSIVLKWIQSPSNRWKTFVANGVTFIHEETSSVIWRHVPTVYNPADLISRGGDPTIPSFPIIRHNTLGELHTCNN